LSVGGSAGSGVCFVNVSVLDKFLPIVLPPCIAQVVGRGTPIDFNKKFIDSKPIFGRGKTWVGTLGSLGISFFILKVLYITGLMFTNIPEGNFDILVSILLTGSILGDLCNSFVKRRLSIERGGKFIGDRINSPVGGFVFTYIICPGLLFSVYSILDMIVITVAVGVAHILMSKFAYRIGIKKEGW